MDWNAGRVLIGVFLAVVLAASAQAQDTLYVDTSAGGADDGTSWTDADTTLQDPSSFPNGAFSYATGNDEIWGAQGTCTPASATDSLVITGAQDILKVYGGFGGTESSRSAREPNVHRTILSGDIGGDDTDSDGDNIVKDISNIQGAHSNYVLYLDGTTNSGPITRATRIDGVVVTAGRAGGIQEGVGMYCQANASSAECSLTLARMVSAIPDKGIKAALQGAYGTYDRAVWRLMQWSASEENYRGFPDLDSLSPGEGFWLVTRTRTPPVVDGGETVEANSAQTIPLQAGWNQVGTPFGVCGVVGGSAGQLRACPGLGRRAVYVSGGGLSRGWGTGAVGRVLCVQRECSA